MELSSFSDSEGFVSGSTLFRKAGGLGVERLLAPLSADGEDVPPTRRRVGGTSSPSADRGANRRSTPRPPALRKSVEPDTKPSESEKLESSTPRRSWRGRLGLTQTKEK